MLRAWRQIFIYFFFLSPNKLNLRKVSKHFASWTTCNNREIIADFKMLSWLCLLKLSSSPGKGEAGDKHVRRLNLPPYCDTGRRPNSVLFFLGKLLIIEYAFDANKQPSFVLPCMHTYDTRICRTLYYSKAEYGSIGQIFCEVESSLVSLALKAPEGGDQVSTSTFNWSCQSPVYFRHQWFGMVIF